VTGKIDLIYILSPSYSGSTLLTFLLGQHPAIATIGELKGTAMGDVQEYLCSCGARILECEFWVRVRCSAKEQGIELDLAHYDTHFGSDNTYFGRLANMSVRGKLLERIRSGLLQIVPGYTRYVDNLIDRNASLMQIIMREQNGKIFLDGSKDPRRLSHFLESLEFNVKVIRLFRDGRGVSNSFAANERLTYGGGIETWIRASDQIDRIFDNIPPENSIVVKYEDLCLGTKHVLLVLTEFIGIGEVPMKKEIPLKSSHINGNKMRLAGTADIKLNEKWREQLTASDLDLFERKAGQRNRTYGYA